MKTLAERLIWSRGQRGFSQQEVADRSGVAQSTIGSLESGARQSARKITSIANALDVDAVWLAEGKGQPEATGPGGLKIGQFSPVNIEINGNPNVLLIPQVRLRLQAGVTGWSTEGEPGADTYPLDRSWVLRERLIQEHLIAIRVKGESMEPGLYDGDIVVINTADTKPLDGNVYAVNYEGEAVIKRLSRDAGSWWLTSDNPDQRKYHRKSVRGSECILVGKAVKKESTRL